MPGVVATSPRVVFGDRVPVSTGRTPPPESAGGPAAVPISGGREPISGGVAISTGLAPDPALIGRRPQDPLTAVTNRKPARVVATNTPRPSASPSPTPIKNSGKEKDKGKGKDTKPRNHKPVEVKRRKPDRSADAARKFSKPPPVKVKGPKGGLPRDNENKRKIARAKYGRLPGGTRTGNRKVYDSTNAFRIGFIPEAPDPYGDSLKRKATPGGKGGHAALAPYQDRPAGGAFKIPRPLSPRKFDPSKRPRTGLAMLPRQRVEKPKVSRSTKGLTVVWYKRSPVYAGFQACIGFVPVTQYTAIPIFIDMRAGHAHVIYAQSHGVRGEEIPVWIVWNSEGRIRYIHGAKFFVVYDDEGWVVGTNQVRRRDREDEKAAFCSVPDLDRVKPGQPKLSPIVMQPGMTPTGSFLEPPLPEASPSPLPQQP